MAQAGKSSNAGSRSRDGETTSTRGDTTSTDASTATTDTDTRTTDAQAPAEPVSTTSSGPLPGETSNTYAERVDLDNAVTNARTSPPRDV